MKFSLLSKLLGRGRGTKDRAGGSPRRKRLVAVEPLEERALLAITATFSAGVLSVFGDALHNSIEVSRDSGGGIMVNAGVVGVQGGVPTVANTNLIQVYGLGGNDHISFSEANGGLPRGSLFGGAGNDMLIGGSAADMIFGQGGDDVLEGRGGADLLFGRAGNDTLTGGDGDDQVFGESGHDRMIWNPGDDTDLNEGGTDIDSVEVRGAGAAEQFTATANGTRVRFDRLDPAPFSLDIGTSEYLVVNMGGGADQFSATGNLAALIEISVDGGSENDTILGSNGNDLLIGGDGNDFVDGNQCSDTIFLGTGDDTFEWDPGDGSDVVEGQAGFDTMRFNGSNGNEIFDAFAKNERFRLMRNLGNIMMDVDDVERVNLETLGGADVVNVEDLSGTDAVEFNVNLAGPGGTGDAQADHVIVQGREEADVVTVAGGAAGIVVSGLAAMVRLSGLESTDRLIVNGLGGDDGLNATPLAAGAIQLTLDGGVGNDNLEGSQGDDVLLGGEGHDTFQGRQGSDLAFMGAGDDLFQWFPGDGSDVLEGQEGIDTLFFFGSNVAESVDVSANAGRVRLLHDVAAVTMDLDDTERLEFRALGGADAIVIGDLGGTDMTDVGLDLRGPAGGGDGAADTITVNGSQGADAFGAAGDAGGVTVFGLQARVNVFHQEQAHDRLILNGLGGDDLLDATSLEADGIRLSMNGGLGNDVFLGSEGADLVNGGDGDDVALMGAGDDVFVWNPGDDDDVVEGQSGFDSLEFNGANVSEFIDLSANGGRVRFFRNVASVTMDLNDVERVNFNAHGGADTIVVNDLSGTDVVEVDLNLAAFGGTGDGQADTVVVQGTDGDDVAIVVGDSSGASVLGLATQVHIAGTEAANDRLAINMLAGDDVMEGSGLAADSIQLVSDGGEGNDVLVGSDGNDVLFGGNGDDVLIGRPGLDVLDGGDGDDIEIQ